MAKKNKERYWFHNITTHVKTRCSTKKTYELTTQAPHNVKSTVFNSIKKGKRREKLVL